MIAYLFFIVCFGAVVGVYVVRSTMRRLGVNWDNLAHVVLVREKILIALIVAVFVLAEAAIVIKIASMI